MKIATFVWVLGLLLCAASMTISLPRERQAQAAGADEDVPEVLDAPSLSSDIHARDEVRGLLARVDNEARTALLHPSDARVSARAAARYARAAAGRLRGTPELVPDAAVLARQANALDEAAQRFDPVDVQARAAVVEEHVRRLDDSLPPAPRAP